MDSQGPPPSSTMPPGVGEGPRISQQSMSIFLILCMAICTIFVLLRSVARWVSTRKLPYEGEDIAVYVALMSLMIQCGLYFAVMPTLYNLIEVVNGRVRPGPDFETQTSDMVKLLMSIFCFFWLTLWSVKVSLLLIYKKLTNGLPKYKRVWWAVLGFVVFSYFGALIVNGVTYPIVREWYTGGAAEILSKKASAAEAASLWYSYTVDMLTDVLIMAIPLRLLWNLQITLRQKLGLAVIFTVGLITIAFGTVRAVDLCRNQSNGPVSTQWLIFWSGMESMVAIIVASLPSFAVFLRRKLNSRAHTNDSHGAPGSANVGSVRYGPVQALQASRVKHQMRVESVQLGDVDAESEGKSSLGEPDTITVTKQWTQRWDNQER